MQKQHIFLYWWLTSTAFYIIAPGAIRNKVDWLIYKQVDKKYVNVV